MTITKSICKMLKKCGVQCEERGYFIETDSIDAGVFDEIVAKIQKKCPTAKIEVYSAVSGCLNNKKILVNTMPNRIEMMDIVKGIGYRESYGYFTTEFGETFISDDLEIFKEVSLQQLIDEEKEIVRVVNKFVCDIENINRALGCIEFGSDKYKYYLKERSELAKKLDAEKTKLAVARKNIRAWYV